MTNDTGILEDALIGLTTDIVAAYVSNNPVSAADLPRLIQDTHGAVHGLRSVPTAAVEEKPVPAVSIRRSVTPEFLICLEDGQKYKSLKRHLATHHNLTPDEYRQKWNLPAGYPMVAPNYSAARSALAKQAGLGRKPAPAPEPEKPVVQARKKNHGLKFS